MPAVTDASLVAALLTWFAKNARDLPWRRTKDPYGVFISEIMLQQTQVKTVIPYYERWMRELPSVDSLARAKTDRVLKLWEGLGYYSRARRAQAAAKLIMEEHRGQFPDRFEDVLALPGIGRYTAGAICSIAFNQPTPILDGNVARVLSRVFGIAGDPREKSVRDELWAAADATVRASGSPSLLNQAMMELGALICQARSPNCAACPVQSRCFARRENRVAEFPAASPRPTATARRFVALIVTGNGRFFVRKRTGDVVNAGLWEFPNFEVEVKTKKPPRVAPFKILGSEPLIRVRHSITRYRILLEAFHAELLDGQTVSPGIGAWKTPSQMRKLAFTGAHRKVAEAALGIVSVMDGRDGSPSRP